MKRLIFILLLSGSMCAQDAWQQMNDFLFPASFKASFVIDDFGYAFYRDINSEDIEIYRYEFASDSWTQLNDFPNPVATKFDVMQIQNVGYLLYSNDMDEVYLYEYIPANDSWTQKASSFYSDFGFFGLNTSTFSINDKGYLLTSGDDDAFREYDPALDSWTPKTDYPFPNDGDQIGFSVNGKGYLVYTEVEFPPLFAPYVHSYDPTTNLWVRKADFPDPAPASFRPFTSGFVIDGTAYVGSNIDTGFGLFWRYDATSDEWETITACGYTGGNAFNFVYEGRGYVGGGGFINGSGMVENTDEVWRLDPDLLSVNDFDLSFKIYPNPATNEIYLPDSSLIGAEYSIYDLSSKMVLSGMLAGESIDIAGLAAGMYIIQLRNDELTLKAKFLKM